MDDVEDEDKDEDKDGGVTDTDLHLWDPDWTPSTASDAGTDSTF